jgi:hypothetical protein
MPIIYGDSARSEKVEAQQLLLGEQAKLQQKQRSPKDRLNHQSSTSQRACRISARKI